MHDPKLQSDIDEFAGIIIDKKQITLGNLLGSGAYGKVKLISYFFVCPRRFSLTFLSENIKAYF